MQKNTRDSFSILKRVKSFKFAINGIYQAVRTQHSIWVQLSIALMVIVLGWWFEISTAEWLFILFAIGFVLSAEIFNSAIESLVDLVSPEYNSLAGKIKDMAAGAVLVAAITAAIVGLLIFVPRILNLL